MADQATPAMSRNRSLFGCRDTPLWSVIQPRIDRYHVGLHVESLESRRMLDAPSWVAAGSGNWDVAACWSTDAVPTSASSVTISPTVASTITILPGESDTVAGLTLGNSDATLSVSSPDYTNPTSNLLTNPGFESPEATNGKTSPAYWNTWINPTGTGLAYLSTSYAHTGTQSFVVSGTNCGADLPAARIAATAGASYTLSVYAMTPGLTGNADGYLNLYFYNASGTSTGDSSINILNSSSAAGGPLAGSVGALGWNHFYTTMVAPASTVTMDAQMTLWDPSGGGSVYFDDVELGPTATADPAALTAGSISNSGTILVGPTNTVTVSGTLTRTFNGRPRRGHDRCRGRFHAHRRRYFQQRNGTHCTREHDDGQRGVDADLDGDFRNLGRPPLRALPRSRPRVFPTAACCSSDPRPRPPSAARLRRPRRARSTFNWAGPLQEATASSTSRGRPRWPAR